MFLIDLFVQVLKYRPNSILVLAGNGDLRPAVERYVIESGLEDKVKFLGQRDDAWRLYQAFDVFALPSLYEGLGLVGIEAQRAGLPCLLSDRITHEVDVTETCQFLPIDNLNIWANALCTLDLKTDAERAAIDPENFVNYDIVRQSAWLTDKYIELVREAGICVDQ
jgi:glycosyltransferase EpsF